MNFAAYAEIWRLAPVRQAVVLGALGKAPWFGAVVVLTLHVVGALGQSYASAGALTAVFTIAIAIASPVRGRLLDRIGLRATLAPSLVLLPAAFIAATFLGYWPLLAVMGVVGLLAIPWFPLTRQLMIAAVPVRNRRAALALDSVVTEIAFMAGPTLGVLLATWNSGWTLAGLGTLSVAAAAVLAWRNPPLMPETTPETLAAPPAPDAQGPAPTPTPADARGSIRTWLSAPVVTTFVATVAVSFTLAGTDLAMVAASRAMESGGVLAVLILCWGAGSLVGGLLYGGLPPGRLGLTTLVVGLAVSTALGSLGTSTAVLAALMAVAGLFCAPSLAAISERLGDLVPAASRGEAFGWQGTFSTLGSALAPPLVGWVMDTGGWRPGYLATGLIGLALAGVGWVALRVGRRGVRRSRERARVRTSAPDATIPGDRP